MPNRPIEYHVHHLSELPSLAKKIIALYPEPTVFALQGKMGAGKTTLVKALCLELGAAATSSPTFSLVNEYEGKNGVRIFHFDLYRLNRLEEALDIGFEEYLDQKAYVFIEWPELVLPLLSNLVTLEIRNDEEEIRRVTLV